MSTWPVSLPTKQFIGVTTQDGESRLISPMDAGPASVRNRFSAITQDVSTRIVLTGAQLATFNTFFRTTLNHGSTSFTWTNPTDDSSVSYRFKTKPKFQCIKPDSDVNARLWEASLDLEILP